MWGGASGRDALAGAALQSSFANKFQNGITAGCADCATQSSSVFLLYIRRLAEKAGITDITLVSIFGAVQCLLINVVPGLMIVVNAAREVDVSVAMCAGGRGVQEAGTVVPVEVLDRSAAETAKAGGGSTLAERGWNPEQLTSRPLASIHIYNQPEMSIL